jgi:hypothetical protein
MEIFFTMQTDKEEMVIAVAFAVVVVAVIGAITSAIYFDREEHKEKPVTLTQEQVRDPKTVESRLHVTQPEARTIVREIERTGGETPSITYYVQSPTVGAQFLGVVVQDIEACLDARSHHDGFRMEIPLAHGFQDRNDRRNDGGNDDILHVLESQSIQLEKGAQKGCIAVSGLQGIGGHPPMADELSLLVYTAHNIRISHIKSKKHVNLLRNRRPRELRERGNPIPPAALEAPLKFHQVYNATKFPFCQGKS